MSKMPVDEEPSEALAADKSRGLLNALDHRQKTPMELSLQLGLDEGAVRRHLEQLGSAGLVQQEETEPGSVSYSLTWKGKRVLHPDKLAVALLLSASFGALVTGAVALSIGLTEERASALGALQGAAFGLGLLALVLIGSAWWVARRAKARRAAPDS